VLSSFCSNLPRVRMHTTKALNAQTTMHAPLCTDTALQAADKRNQWLTWKKLTSITVAVCFVIVLHFDAARMQLHLGNSPRKLSAPAGLAGNISAPVYLSAGPSRDMSSLVDLPVGLSENMSSQQYLSGKIFDAAVNSVCVCNPTSTDILIFISETNIPTKYWLSSNGCECSGTLAPHATENQKIGCWYAQPGGGTFVLSRCQGGQFFYSRYSNLAGRYVCTVSPAVCSKQGFCRPPFCT